MRLQSDTPNKALSLGVTSQIELISPTASSYKARLLRRSVQSQADSGLPTQLIPVAFRPVNHTFLYLYPRDT
jgi:hypothetical protein